MDREGDRRQADEGRDALFDLVVIGGGVNGCAIARDAAGRNLRVLLLEAGDLAGGTSSASSKLIHGGLRYLKYGEFRLVREALAERARLLEHSPHVVRPLRILIPRAAGRPRLAPAPLLGIGLFLYDHLAERGPLPAARSVRLTDDERARLGLVPAARRAFVYADGATEDARLVVLIARDAAERGAEIRTRTAFLGARREGRRWRIEMRLSDGTRAVRHARALVNAAGPWVDRVNTRILPVSAGRARPRLTLVQGSHIVVRRLFAGDDGLLLPQADGRVVFVLPFGPRHHLVGTTERHFVGDPAHVRASEDEIAYLLASLRPWLASPPRREDIVHVFAGVRPLYDPKARSMSAASRHYVLDLEDDGRREAPLLVVHGGKLTSFRALAERALDLLARTFPQAGGPWTATAPLPGGEDIAGPDGFRRFRSECAARWPFLGTALLDRLTRAYGRRIEEVLDGVRTPDDLGRDFGHGLHEREVDHLITREWARTAEDVLWRRSTLGLDFTAGQTRALAQYLATREARGRHPLGGIGNEEEGRKKG